MDLLVTGGNKWKLKVETKKKSDNGSGETWW